MLSDPGTWRLLLERLADIAVASLRAQVQAGAQAVQLFDSWIGSLTPAQYVTYVQPVVRRLLDRLADLGVPRIMFGVGTGHLLEHMAAAGPDALGVDWRIPLDDARSRLPAGLERWSVAWQSAGRTADPWIGPDVLEVLPQLAGDGAGAVVVCTAGFVADHLEILYDLDIEARDRAAGLGLAFARTASPNDHPAFVAALADVIRDHLQEPSR
jgi:hypothetical protein